MPSIREDVIARLRYELQARAGIDPSIPRTPYVPFSTETPQRVRQRNRGQLTAQRTPLCDVFQDEISDAARMIAMGDFSYAAKISQLALTNDSWVQGVFGTFVASIARLPRKFGGDAEICRALSETHTDDGDPRSLFDSISRASEIAALVTDARMLGVAVGELVYIDQLDHPILVRLSPEFLRLDRNSNTWTYQVASGAPLLVEPGNGNWFLMTPGSATEPWTGGIWASVAREFARKQEAQLNMDAWMRKHASPIRVGQTSVGSTAQDSRDLLEQLVEWSGTNTSCVLPAGWTLDLKETNGQGYQSYAKAIELANEALTIAIAGQLITTTGSQGFANGDMGLVIRADLTKHAAASFSAAVTDQVLPYCVARKWGSGDRKVAFSFDVDGPSDKSGIARAVTDAATALSAIANSFATAKAAGLDIGQPDLHELMLSFGIPQAPEPEAVAPVLELVPDTSTAPSDGEPAAPEEEEQKASDSALNGAQVSSLLEVIAQVVAGQLPRDSAIEIIKVAFNLDHGTADRLLGEVGRGFTPTPTTEAVA
jgi:hypothetical protein